MNHVVGTSSQRLRIRQGTCAVALSPSFPDPPCGWPTYQEGTEAYCTNPHCPAYRVRARELQALAVQLELVTAIEKLSETLSTLAAK
jgi:hypothetical protein